MTIEQEEIPESSPPSVTRRAVGALKTLRWWMVLPLPLGIIVINSFGPDGWREPAERMLWMSWACVYLAIAHAFRRVLLKRLDLTEAVERAMKGDVAASILSAAAMIFMAMVFMGLVSYAKAQDVRTHIPTNARALLPMLAKERSNYWPDHPMPSYFGALIEHESCLSLTHSRCWNPKAQLKTSREEGAGLGQFTRAYTASGALRFDAIAEVRQLDPVALREFNWSSVYARADLSMRAILVKQRDCYRRIERQTLAGPRDRVAFCDAAYNGGFGGLMQDRRLCDAAPACDPHEWFGHVERYSAKSRLKWQGYGKSAFEINRFHVHDCLRVRRAKYIPFLGADAA